MLRPDLSDPSSLTSLIFYDTSSVTMVPMLKDQMDCSPNYSNAFNELGYVRKRLSGHVT